MKIKEKDFGNDYKLITIENEAGTKLDVSDFGARIVNWNIPIGNETRNIVLGFDSAVEYLENDPYIGASIGRIAGRIEKGKFKIGNKNFQIPVDATNGHSLHNSPKGFELKKWNYKISIDDNEASVIFSSTSPNNENGFPGNLKIEVVYTLTEDNVWQLKTTGSTDQDTLFNPTNHVYFNLSGDVTQSIDEHTFWLNSNYFAPVRTDVIPLGIKKDVTGTPFDFRRSKKLSEVFNSDFEQKNLFDGMDHPFFLDDTKAPIAILCSEDEKIRLTISTDASSVVLYTANFGEHGPRMHGKKLVHHGGITFETQTAPGAEQFSEFGSILLQKNKRIETITEFRIDI
ncbi:aldose 1-epimerase [Enterococcus sp. DIV2402]|uniref:Aldose 1-epimerase n=1 Tax=Candidatus Enterococcus lowellii TaxID=2230877 RepID=A0ABZ2SQF1_9ENTE|nr:galactose-1-epimerase [Enterococcus sp. DIV2402]MBO0463279.1 galactose-1-epimerase [Enterococcus sp. DIV2402]